MNVEAALAFTNTVIFTETGKHLTNLQSVILQEVWQGKKYLEIAESYGYTEGYIKDVAYLLWKLLSEALGERVTKTNFQTVLERQLKTKTATKTLPILEFDVSFIGRSSAIAHLNTLVNRGNKIIVIQGEGGIGKTTLAQQYLKKEKFELVLELLMAKETQNITSVESIIEEWLKKELNEEPGREFGITLGRLKRHLEKRRIGILIDNLEPALDRHGMLIEPHRRYVELLRILADVSVQSITLITSRDRLCEFDITIAHYRLPGLAEQDWEQFFGLQQINSDLSTLKTIHKTYGGNAKAMGILCGLIQEDFAQDMKAYWQENQSDPLGKTNLKNLVSSQFNRLQTLDPDAYKLLCRLGCYRYQDVPKVSQLALFKLLWDLEIGECKRIIESLRNRSLVEFSKGYYWLHPVIRTEAIARLKATEEWKIVNQKAAQFWTESIKRIETMQDGITALEAYYHYVEIQDFEQAGKVILRSRDNQWGQFLPLGSTLYRMGLLQPILFAITQIIAQIKSDNLGELYNILGDLYWITGQIHQAIVCQEKTILIAQQCFDLLAKTPNNKHQKYYFKMLEIDSLLSLGLYKIDLWELAAAANFFQQVIKSTTNTAHDRWGQKASICLALVNSYLGFKQEAATSANIFYQAIITDNLLEPTGRFAYFIQLLGQTYINLGEFKKAFELSERVITFSNESHYPQVKGKALTGLAEIYRNQNNFDSAISNHLEAIELLEAIGAKCDLAEAYFQLGLTYQTIGAIAKSKNPFNRAIQLFTEMAAPRQVEKVQARQ